ncbi:MAG: hypothetical protein ACE5EA_09535 [Nitrospirota bacterium]
MFKKRLYPLIYTEQNLNDAWNKVKGNKGIAGSDDMDITRFDKNIFPNLKKIQDELRSGAYQVKPVKEIKVKKKDGGSRILGILTIKRKNQEIDNGSYISYRAGKYLKKERQADRYC